VKRLLKEGQGGSEKLKKEARIVVGIRNENIFNLKCL